MCSLTAISLKASWFCCYCLPGCARRAQQMVRAQPCRTTFQATETSSTYAGYGEGEGMWGVGERQSP